MKFFKRILSLILLFSILSMDAKKRGAQAAPATKPTSQPAPAQPPIAAPKPMRPMPESPVRQQQPTTQPQSYPEALNTIKTKMTADQVLINNTFNPQFINFVKSLNLSAIETQALLQAGANIYATWSDNNENNKNILSSLRANIQIIMHTQPTRQPQPIQPSRQVRPPQPPVQQFIPPQQKQPTRSPKPTQPFVQPRAFKPMKPIQNIGPAEDRFFMNDLVMLLDPRKKETVQNGAESMVQQGLIALYQKAAPVIMTTNIFEILITLRQQIGDQELQKLRTMRHPQLTSYAQQLAQKTRIPNIHFIYIILLSSMDFDTTNINYYFHTSENLVLLIPKQYIQANVPSAINLNLNDQARLCGFNPAVLNAVTDLSSNNLMQRIQAQKAKPIVETQFVAHLTAMFTIQKKNGELIHPEQTSKWIIYLGGHGGPGYVVPGKTAQGGQMMVISQIAGLSKSQFSQLMQFFDESIDTAYVHYITCFSGGSNQTFVNETLSSLDVHFVVSSQGIQEGETSASFGAQSASDKLGIQITGQDLAEFFKRLNMFFTPKEPQKKVPYVKNKRKKPIKTKKEMEDPVAKILQTISGNNNDPQNQPFVRFPAVESFVATALDRKTMVLTGVLAKAHEIEQKPFNINADLLIINTPRINVPVNLGKRTAEGHTAIVLPSPEKFLKGYEAFAIFKEINWQDSLQSLLFNCSYLNAHQYPQTFVINTLSGILLQQSGLPAPKGSSNIKHLMVSMQPILGKNMTGATQSSLTLGALSPDQVKIGTIGNNINACFEFNDSIYQCAFAISDIKNPTALLQNMERIRFAATPKNSINMNAIASNFLSPQEVAKVAKPITLESIAQFINSKIDKQDPSMAIWSGAEIEDLRKFAADRANK